MMLNEILDEILPPRRGRQNIRRIKRRQTSYGLPFTKRPKPKPTKHGLHVLRRWKYSKKRAA